MTANQFYNHWIAFVEGKNPEDISEAYKNLTSWTNFTIGASKNNLEKTHPFANYLEDKTGLEYRSEVYSLDFAFGSKEFFKGIKRLDNNIQPLNEQFLFSPLYEILLEHENNIGASWDEMIKLTRFRARLKVLITYNWHIGHKNNEQAKQVAINNFQTIINQANQGFPENPNTEYLLIIGELDNNEDRIKWKNYVWKVGQESASVQKLS